VARKSSHVFRQLPPVWRPIPLLARSLSPVRTSHFQISVAGPLDFERLGHRDSKHACRSLSCSRPCAPVTPGPSEYHIRLLADESQKNGASNGMSPALQSPRCEQPLVQLFAALIREDDTCIVVRLRGQRSISSREKPLPSPLSPSVRIFPIQRIGQHNSP